MAYKTTVRGAPPAIIRRVYRCDDCSWEFSWLHATTDEAPPECPRCAVSASAMPATPAITTNKSRAVDIAQSMAEDMGLTDMSDNQREGDVAFKGPSPIQTAEKEVLTRTLIEAGVQQDQAVQMVSPQAAGFWQGGMGGGGTPSLDSARSASQAQKAQGVDAVGLLEKGRETGNMNIKFDVVSSAKG